MDPNGNTKIDPIGQKLIKNENIQRNVDPQKERSLCCTTIFLICGLINILIGILALKYDFLKLVIEEKIRMRSGLPALEWWRNPPVDITLSVYIFNVTNSQQFQNGQDKLMHLEEVGPIVFKEIIRQVNVEHHHENSTLSYSSVQIPQFLPDKNEPGILNKTIITPNAILLAMAGIIQDASILSKVSFNLIAQSDQVFINTTIYDMLWNLSTPVLDTIKIILPFLVPRENGGILYNLYYQKKRRFNVNIGDKHGFEDFFKINSYNGWSTIPGFEYETRKSCPVWLENATDGTHFSPYLTKESVLTAWTSPACTTIPLKFEHEIKRYGMKLYRFALKEDVFDRLPNRTEDCHKGFSGNELPNGLSDSSQCAFDTPVATSLPHFYGRHGKWEEYVTGLKPDKYKHWSYSIIEPTSGIIMKQVGRLQNNLVLPPLDGFKEDIELFSNFIIPTFWLEYRLDELTSTMIFLLTLLINVLPILQHILLIVVFILAIAFLWLFTTNFQRIRKSKANEILCNKNHKQPTDEQNRFLPKIQ